MHVLSAGKFPLTMSRISYGTLLRVILIYNSKPTSSILTKFSGNKRSGMENMLAKFRSLEIVAMETVTDSLFFSMTNISARGQGIVLKFWQCVLLDQRYILCSEHSFMRLTDFLL